jgi:DNA-binding response OmpR family regulator
MTFNGCVQFEDVSVIFPELMVRFRGNDIHLSLTELRLLLIFLSDPYGCFRTEELVRRLGINSRPQLNVLVNRIRVLLDQKYIHNRRGYGYAFAEEKN